MLTEFSVLLRFKILIGLLNSSYLLDMLTCCDQKIISSVNKTLVVFLLVSFLPSVESHLLVSRMLCTALRIYYLLTGCEGRTVKY